MLSASKRTTVVVDVSQKSIIENREDTGTDIKGA